jgi:polynucleotide kinase-phosphatase
MTFTIPELSLVVLIGPSGCGKSTFARKHFKPTELMSSDGFRALVSDDENDQSSTDDAFAALHFVAARRLARGKLTVVDATNVQPEARKPLVALAREYHVLPVAIVLDLPERVCHDRNRSRPDRNFGPHVIRNQKSQLHRSLRGLGREGFRHVHVLKSQEEVDAALIERQPLWNNRKGETGPFDIIGDVHGCCDELEQLLQLLGYERNDGGPWTHSAGRKAIFVGDLVDRGPRIVDTLKTVMTMSQAGTALSVPGNHDIKLKRKLEGRDVTVSHGLHRSLEELEQETSEFRAEVQKFLDGLVSHYVFDDGRLVVAHAGMKAEMQGRGSAKVRDFALFGETTGETDEFGLPVRYNWAAEYRGRASVVYGHTPVPEPEWLNRTINIDTGCVFGGKLTALRWPEKELVSVLAKDTYADPVRPFIPVAAPSLNAQQANDDLLDIEDVRGKRLVTTRLHRNVTIREENAAAALEAMSRFAANPKWLIYLPPTMSPSETSKREGLLEHPAEAFLLPIEWRGQRRRGAEAHGLPRHHYRVPRPGDGATAVRSPRSRGWHLLHAHGTSLLRERRARTRIARVDSERARSTRVLGALQDGLGVPRLRADAVVGEGSGTRSPAVRVSRNGGAHRLGRDRSCTRTSCGSRH